MAVDLSVEFCGLSFENPFVLAPSPTTEHPDLIGEAFEAGWAGAVLKTISLESPNLSRVYPLVSRVTSRNRNRSGEEAQDFIALHNIDLFSAYTVDEVAKRINTLKRQFPTKVIAASITGKRKEDWQYLTKRLVDAGVDLIQCSISCPHGTEAYLGPYVQDPQAMMQIAYWVKETARETPVIMKLSPQVSDIAVAAQAVKTGGADGVCAVNTLKSISGVDLETFIPLPAVGGFSTVGGLSGPALKPVALRCTAEIARKVDTEIAASGGITTWMDAAEFLLLGAKTLQVCTAVLRYGIGVIEDLREGLAQWMKRKGFQNIAVVSGKSLPYLMEHSQLPRGLQVIAKINPETCTSCGVCLTVCHTAGYRALVTTPEGRYAVDQNQCGGCGICQAMCPQGAISFIRPSGRFLKGEF